MCSKSPNILYWMSFELKMKTSGDIKWCWCDVFITDFEVIRLTLPLCCHFVNILCKGFTTFKRIFPTDFAESEDKGLSKISSLFKTCTYLITQHIRTCCQTLATNFCKTILRNWLKFFQEAFLAVFLVKQW